MEFYCVSLSIVRGYGLDGGGFNSQQGQDFSLLHSIQTIFGTHPASYPMSTGDNFPRGKVARV
jgi:hypothetical protein